MRNNHPETVSARVHPHDLIRAMVGSYIGASEISAAKRVPATSIS